MMKNIKKHIEMPVPPEGSPGMFRCAKPGLIKDLFSEVGFNHVEEGQIDGKIDCETAENYWDFMTEIAAPFVTALEGAEANVIEKIRIGVVNDVNEKFPIPTSIDTFAYVISGVK